MSGAYCETSSEADGYLKQLFCGASEYVGELGSTVVGVTSNAKDAAVGVSGNASAAAQKAANPLNFGALGLGLASAGTVTVVGVGLLVGEAVDQIVFEGAGTRWVLSRFSGRRRR